MVSPSPWQALAAAGAAARPARVPFDVPERLTDRFVVRLADEAGGVLVADAEEHRHRLGC
jgi:hypothetical protein